MSSTAEFAQGWYADPHGGSGLRWWDGTTWTDHVAAEPAGVHSEEEPSDHDAEPAAVTAAASATDPAVAGTETAAVAATEPAGTAAENESERTGPIGRVAGTDQGQQSAPGSGGMAAVGHDAPGVDPAVPVTAASLPPAASAATPVAEQTVVVMRKASPPAATGTGTGTGSSTGTAERGPDLPASAARSATSLPATTSFPAQQYATGSFPAQQYGTGSFPAQQYGTGSFPAPQYGTGSSSLQPYGSAPPGPAFGRPGPAQQYAASPWGQPGAQPAAVPPPYGGPAAPAAWLQDPHGPGLRWWDGSAWTAHTAPAGQAAPGGNTVNVNGGSTTVVVGGGKSVGVAFLLTFFFGPIGLLYATVVGGLIMIGVELFLLILGLVTFGLAWLFFGFTWVICIVWGCIAAGKQPPVQVVHH